ncbi:MarR family transcriptional regulator [Pseudooceanicola sp. CBS1P-1]|uniref:MarR family transcriptional regulator n=1 Tax=Pseudooceanicola albus TaxID=2692189 RepID=A0A6L7FWZ3_9RHOB|nr:MULTISPECIES: MarR family transcriptional regulator [Pseudooceanicola]MBT9383943.1 MarR family transcriptional regulator [Pseudooceanicola endophyticus]MXN16644.1 MarR family transcriptional regulator [Pseudooceanicola albus]
MTMDPHRTATQERVDERSGDMLRAVMLLARTLRKTFDHRAKSLGLTFARAQAMLAIARQEGMSQSHLAETLDIEAPTMNRTLDGLEEAGFIERRPQPHDRRVRQVFLTGRSRAHAEEIFDFSTTLRAELVRGIPPEELAATEATLQKMHANLQRMTANAKG